MQKRVVVTGGAGFIGSHLVESLLSRGYRVRVLDNLSQGRREWVSSAVDFVLGDVRDLETCRTACEGVGAVFHLAALSRVAPSLDNCEACTSNNVTGTQNMLMAARDARAGHFIYAGSSTYYGKQQPPHVEDMRPDLLNFYGF